jgi:hypothetical protein
MGRARIYSSAAERQKAYRASNQAPPGQLHRASPAKEKGSTTLTATATS